ncbi:MAG: SEC-C metal-binding domain-containing protein [Candidatus Accumulibacter sp. UW20]|jgi:hypothetical protein
MIAKKGKDGRGGRCCSVDGVTIRFEWTINMANISQLDRAMQNRRPPTEQRSTRRTLTFEECFFELPGEDPLWIWVHTCPEPRCACRNAVVLASAESAEVLRRQSEAVRAALKAGESYVAVAARFEGLIAFILDMDSVLVSDLKGEPLTPLAMHPQVAAVVARMHGDVLDAIARLWYVGKGYPDQRELVLRSPTVTISDWRRGDMVAYDNIFRWVRKDVYFVEEEPDEPFEAFEMYCVTPECTCGEVYVVFARRDVEDLSGRVGIVEVSFSGTAVCKPGVGQEALFDRLWGAYRRRHPAYLARFAARTADMKHIGSRIPVLRAAAQLKQLQAGFQRHQPHTSTPVIQVRAAPRVGRNDPCACGSGKKFKKCCGG